MAYDLKLAERIREYLEKIPGLNIEEKKMFRGLTFMVNGKMCVNVSGTNLMCRFDPGLQEEIMGRRSVLPVIMKGNEYKGYCYVEPAGCRSKTDFEYWVDLCLAYNKQAKSSKKSR
ncbi:TfoX/Sxy family protein [Chitinophaga sp. XS-30]|uniref:TfoX/Sxy family protein n=1 Tax=Chitinophaga sp. XS-30 TaxID=2604421 RepID=UPI0011DDED96|nr:TfoX/Sxy family protein [Chitinophaga sp. XS-30]QEH39737.1 TfoX/Sxy family protein [Chitinophaga sp. XS-30]